jgi:hypothetical protein
LFSPKLDPPYNTASAAAMIIYVKKMLLCQIYDYYDIYNEYRIPFSEFDKFNDDECFDNEDDDDDNVERVDLKPDDWIKRKVVYTTQVK